MALLLISTGLIAYLFTALYDLFHALGSVMILLAGVYFLFSILGTIRERG